MKISESAKQTRQWASFFFLPVLGLYLLAYRLLGKRCTYHWGNFEVTPLEPISRKEYLFMRLFPGLIALLGLLFIGMVSYFLNIAIN